VMGVLMLTPAFGFASGKGQAISAQWQRLEQARQVLLKSEAGRSLLKRTSEKFGVDLESRTINENYSGFISPGVASRTDSVLNRGIDPATGLETRAFETRIALRVTQPLEDVVLDFAHELTHAELSRPVDPYDPALTAEKYISKAITGAGGEVDAVAAECRIGLELAEKFGLKMERCRKYQSAGSVDPRLILRDFGASGRYRALLVERLGFSSLSRLDWITDREPEFYSSTGGLPYPAALLEEYDELTESACANSRRRVELLSASAPERSSGSGETRAMKEARHFLQSRCGESAPLR
jgi:hypothetical protein